MMKYYAALKMSFHSDPFIGLFNAKDWGWT